MKRDLYAEVSAKIVAELEAGAAPWIKPWAATRGANTPCNAVTNRPLSKRLEAAEAAVVDRRKAAQQLARKNVDDAKLDTAEEQLRAAEVRVENLAAGLALVLAPMSPLSKPSLRRSRTESSVSKPRSRSSKSPPICGTPAWRSKKRLRI